MTNHPELERYLNRLGGNLLGPKRYQRELLAEIRSHLTELADAEGNRSTMADIVRRFGDPDAITAELNEARRTRTRRQTRRAFVTLACIAVIGPAVAVKGFARQNSATHVDDALGPLVKAPMAITLDPRTGAVLLWKPLPGRGAR